MSRVCLKYLRSTATLALALASIAFPARAETIEVPTQGALVELFGFLASERCIPFVEVEPETVDDFDSNGLSPVTMTVARDEATFTTTDDRVFVRVLVRDGAIGCMLSSEGTTWTADEIAGVLNTAALLAQTWPGNGAVALDLTETSGIAFHWITRTPTLEGRFVMAASGEADGGTHTLVSLGWGQFQEEAR